jgi:hypothetical protein
MEDEELCIYFWIWLTCLKKSCSATRVRFPFHQSGERQLYSISRKQVKTLSSSCRPVYLTRCAYKLLNRLVNYRLVSVIESQGLLSNFQYCFQHYHSSSGHLITLKEQARQAFKPKQHLVGVFFDIEETCDSLAKQDSLNS